jgi:hypothetical protein
VHPRQPALAQRGIAADSESIRANGDEDVFQAGLRSVAANWKDGRFEDPLVSVDRNWDEDVFQAGLPARRPIPSAVVGHQNPRPRVLRPWQALGQRLAPPVDDEAPTRGGAPLAVA